MPRGILPRPIFTTLPVMEPLRIMLIGSGGREHALAWKLAQSKLVEAIYAVPGNAGTALMGGKVVNMSNTSAEDFPTLAALAVEKNVNLVVPGPEAPLVAGIEGACRSGKIAQCWIGTINPLIVIDSWNTMLRSYKKSGPDGRIEGLREELHGAAWNSNCEVRELQRLPSGVGLSGY